MKVQGPVFSGVQAGGGRLYVTHIQTWGQCPPALQTHTSLNDLQAPSSQFSPYLSLFKPGTYRSDNLDFHPL